MLGCGDGIEVRYAENESAGELLGNLVGNDVGNPDDVVIGSLDLNGK